MQLNSEQQTQIEEYAGLLFSPEDIVIIMQLDVNEFRDTRLKMDDFRIPYMRGKLLKEAELRKSILKMAVAGSSPAQLLAKDLLTMAKKNEISL